MAKFLKIKIQNTLVSSQTTSAGSSNQDVIDTGVNFTTAGVTAGDIVYNITDGSTHVVDSVTSATKLALVSGSLGGSKDYLVLDASAYTYEFISAENVKFIDVVANAAGTDSVKTNIYYGTGSTGTDVVTIAHSEVGGAFDTDAKVVIQNALEDAHANGRRPDVVKEIELPSGILGLDVTIG